MSTSKSKISDLKIIAYIASGVVCFAILVFAVASVIGYYIQKEPQYKLCVNFLTENKMLQSQFGKIDELQLDDEGTKVDSTMSFSGENRKKSGHYQFRVKGTKRDGIVRIYWNASPNFTPSEIDEIISDGSSVKIWSP